MEFMKKIIVQYKRMINLLVMRFISTCDTGGMGVIRLICISDVIYISLMKENEKSGLLNFW